MSNTEHSAGAAHKSFRCTFGPVREVDLVWPPPDEDIDAFTVVHLDSGDAQPPRLEAPCPEASASEPAASEPARPEPIRLEPRRIKPTFGDCRAQGAAPRVRPLVVPMVPVEPPPLPAAAQGVVLPVAAPVLVVAPPDEPDIPALPHLPIPSAARDVDPETSGASRSAWLAVFFAAACALVTVVEYRGLATLQVDATEAPPVPPQVVVADVPAPVTRAERPSAPRTSPVVASPVASSVLSPTAARTAAVAPTRPIPTPTPAPAPKLVAPPAPAPRLAVATPAREVEPAPSTARVTVAVRDRGPEPPPAVAARVAAPTPKPAAMPAPVAALDTRPESLASAPSSVPVVAAVLTDAASDEADIRSTLTRFRTAYSQLNAGAARDVWPSVDTRALERAFQSLKSQDLRFDSCKMTVTGARAQAACKGRAVYVPRIGDQSPRFTTREWNFELRKADERWTIASARSL